MVSSRLWYRTMRRTAPRRPREPVGLVRRCRDRRPDQVVPGLNTTLAVRWLQMSNELVFEGDSGPPRPTGATTRFAVEWTNFYKPVEWLTLDADFAFTLARYKSAQDAGLRGVQHRHVIEWLGERLFGAELRGPGYFRRHLGDLDGRLLRYAQAQELRPGRPQHRYGLARLCQYPQPLGRLTKQAHQAGLRDPQPARFPVQRYRLLVPVQHLQHLEQEELFRCPERVPSCHYQNGRYHM
jgi:hypothetical protein